MRNTRGCSLVFVVTVVMAGVDPDEALAYIDPSAGGLLVQLLLGGIAGVGVVVKLYWHKITGCFRKKNDDET